jgi:di/tricarboxylate transporter
MTFEIALTLGILGLAIVLFVTERVRADLVALLVLVTLVVVGLVAPEESIAGFANPAVVTIWAVFILSAGLARTGVAAMLGAQVLRLAGAGERRLIAVLMTSTAVLSGFMNNIGVAALFLPITMEIARRTRRSASLLLLPMAYGSLLGGMLVLIGTASNLVVSELLRGAGLEPLGLFDFTPIGVVILVATLAWTLAFGRRLLPDHPVPGPSAAGDGDARAGVHALYALDERLAVLRVPDSSPLAGRTLAESRIGQALGLHILQVDGRDGAPRAPTPALVLRAGDRLLVLGRLDVIEELAATPLFEPEPAGANVARLVTEEVGLAEIELAPGSPLESRTVVELDLRRERGLNLLAVRRGGVLRRTRLEELAFQPGDRLLLHGPPARLDVLAGEHGFRRLDAGEAAAWQLEERLLAVRLPAGSALAGRTLGDTRLAATYGLSVLSVTRDGHETWLPPPQTLLEAGDVLVVTGHPVDLEVVRGLATLTVERDAAADLRALERGRMTMVEVMLPPYTTLGGKTLRSLRFRERFGVSVLALWRGDRVVRSRLADAELQPGDALLCYGPREQFELLAQQRDLVVLDLGVQERPRVEKAPLAGAIMLGVIAVVLAGWLPIYVAAIAGATLMVLAHCLTMEQAYDAIDWKAIFLIAAMLPLGLAMQRTGAAGWLAQGVVDAAGAFGPRGVLAGIVLLTLAINQFIPSAVNAVVMTPIAIATAAGLGVSPYPFVMGIAYAAASSFMTPVSHPVNVLVMSPGGYRFADYLKNGLPPTLIVFVITALLLPVVFPF